MFFDSYILVIILKMLKFTSFVLSETHILSDGSSRELRLPLHLFELSTNG